MFRITFLIGAGLLATSLSAFHSVRLRVASVTRLAWIRFSFTEYDQRKLRSPFQPLTGFHIKTKPRGHVGQARPLGIEFISRSACSS